MFKRTLLSFCALIALVTFAIYWFSIRVSPRDISTYHNIVQETKALRQAKAFEEHPAKQIRQGVQKDIWAQKHFILQSEQSELIFSQKKEQTEAIEKLQNLTLQGDFLLTADEGFYSHPSHQFIAQKNCHFTRDQNTIDGTRIHFDLLKEVITYENPQGHLKNGLEFTAKELIWNKKENKLYLTRQVTIHDPKQSTLIANEGIVSLNEFEPEILELIGDVRVISTRINDKETFALADKLTYHPLNKTILLSSAKKVLFWQEGLSLSASEVFIRPDQTIEGRGNVHFSFDMDEQNYIDQLFKQYL